LARVRTTLPLAVRVSWLPAGARPALAVVVVREVVVVVVWPPAVVVVRELVVVVVFAPVVAPWLAVVVVVWPAVDAPAGLAAPAAGFAGAALGAGAGVVFFC
jgi:hypothetical protein